MWSTRGCLGENVVDLQRWNPEKVSLLVGGGNISLHKNSSDVNHKAKMATEKAEKKLFISLTVVIREW